jgi:hypothetical protein
VYREGVDMFLEFAFSTSAKGNQILCPCKACKNSCWRVSSIVREHLIFEGFTEGYVTWVNHGEPSSSFFTNSRQHERVEVGVVLREEQHSEVISLCLPSPPMCSCYASKLNITLLFAPLLRLTCWLSCNV